ncbi:MAG: hypothetical protein EHM47_04450 [Ignavibacteriales bacterium]|nr:MAG: hypothetical protein EHM47_04450 [Ignavibacteriales bacterium]
MTEEIIKNIKSLPDGMDEIISQVQNNNHLINTLLSNKKFFDDFTSLLSDLNKIVSEREEITNKYSQISLF